MNGIFDTHAHYDATAFNDDRDAVLTALPQQGVIHVINCADCIESAARSQALCEQYDYMYMAAGVHPESAAAVDISKLAEQLHPFLTYAKTVAVGEIGLDYHYEDACPRDKQQQVLEAQLLLAAQYDKPVVIHDREAHADTLALLRKYRPRGVVHCFSGSVEMMREVVSLGMYIGLGGVVTFKNARVPVEVATAVPIDRLLLETDAPYMAPVPMRGKRCDSSLIPYAAAVIAEKRGMDTQELLNVTADNARRLFGIL